MRALVVGASGGIGEAFSRALRQRGYSVDSLSRTDNGFDITDEHVVAEEMGRLEPGFDLVFVATGILSPQGLSPEKSLSQLDPDHLSLLFKVNAIGPALVLKHAKRLLPRDRRCVFAALSARVGSISDNRLGGWYSYRASKAALNQILHTAAIELTRTHKQSICVALHPGTVATSFTEDYSNTHPRVQPENSADNLLAVLDQLEPRDTGNFYDWSGTAVPW